MSDPKEQLETSRLKLNVSIAFVRSKPHLVGNKLVAGRGIDITKKSRAEMLLSLKDHVLESSPY